MFGNVLIGIGELDGGRDAIALARALSVDGAALTLTRIHGGYQTVSRAAHNSLRDTERHMAESTLRHACRVSGIQEAWAFGAPSVGVGMEQLIGYLHSDLIVFSSNARVPSRHTAMPSAVVDTIQRVTCPVTIAPLGYAGYVQPLRRIGVAFEDSVEGHQALTIARHLAEEHQAEVIVLDRFSDGAAASRGIAAEAGRRLQDFSVGVDLLVIGARGGGPLRRMNHASATPSLVRGVGAPVLMVTAQTRMPFGTGQPVTEQWTNRVAAGLRAL